MLETAVKRDQSGTMRLAVKRVVYVAAKVKARQRDPMYGDSYEGGQTPTEGGAAMGHVAVRPCLRRVLQRHHGRRIVTAYGVRTAGSV